MWPKSKVEGEVQLGSDTPPNCLGVSCARIMMLAAPFSAIGAIWLFHLLHCNVSIAARVGMIALLGLDAETGVFMLLFLNLSNEDAKKRDRLRSVVELDEAILHGEVKRARQKLMKVAAAPMIGGLATSFLLELLVYPAVYKLWKTRELGLGRPVGRRVPASGPPRIVDPDAV